jgi:hypothetical protein
MIQRPYSLSIKGTTIDANEDNTITWQVSGDVQTAFQVDIYLNSDNSLAFTSNKITSYALKYTLPQGSLQNGIEYKIKITIYNQAGQSITNDGDIFQTSSRPIITVDPIGTVNSFSYVFSAQYSQAENVSLRNYVVNLYDSQKNLIGNSSILTSLPMEYLFSGLQTETNYYIEFQATSSKGLTGTSGLVLFSVFYYRPKQNVFLQAKNIDKAGIELSWYVKQIIGTSDTTVNFLNNDEVNLLDGNKIYFDDGFSIAQDFSLKVWLRDIANNVPLLTLYGDNGQIVLKYNALQQAFIVEKTTNFSTEKYMSNPVEIRYTTHDEYAFITPYQIELTTQGQQGNESVILIQQIGMDMNVSATTFN